VGRESEGSAIRAVIDRAPTGYGSIVMLWDGPGVGKTRLAMEMADYASRLGFRCDVGRCYEREEPVPYLPFAEIIESSLAQAPSLDNFRQRLGARRPNWLRSRQAFAEFFPISRSRSICRPRNSAAIFSNAFQSRWPRRRELVRGYLSLKIFIGPTNRRSRF
jgi:hypothetical protein